MYRERIIYKKETDMRFHSDSDRHREQRGRRSREHHLGGGRPDFPEGMRPHRGRPGSRHGRAQRGDVRTAALLLLAEQPMHGYQLMQAIADRTEGAWRPSPGAVYPTISQLEDEGLVTITASGGRRLVTMTQAGHDYLAEHRDTMADPFTEVTAQAGGDKDLRGPLYELSAASRQIAFTGNPADISAARRVLAEARRSLYLILAGEQSAGIED